ncbi:glial cell line-derived neurotrophic factor [Alosa sapidissima]|uniref:glial cell line-derived neurotrophic factor n=1 Tax=Alosa sapidissima TaxID=34773 RepID=UPI001C085018|nr:glial cell line-derived neurotrophic factor [Alosa sapidissima]
MIGEVVQVRKDGKRWRRQEVPSMSSAQCHLRTWRVTLWVLASLLALVDGSVAGRDRKESLPAVLRSSERMAWHPANDPQAQEEEETDDRTSWATLFESPSLLEEAEDHQRRWQRSPSDTTSQRPQKNRRKKEKGQKQRGKGEKGRRGKSKESSDCRMERKEVKVRDLDFAYDSDEIVVFKYCVGTCLSARKNYDLALKTLMKNGSIPSHMVGSDPCCRPTQYETVSFMDRQTSWRTIKHLSAANCSCV